MSINPNEDTEFNDALRKHGIIPPRVTTPPTPPPPPSPTLDDLLDDLTVSELQEISEGARDDETERTIAEYRRRRIAEIQREQKKSRFGRVYPIGREDYTREVTEASKLSEEDDDKETGTGVVCFLYQNSIPRNERAFEHVRILAARYPRTKFVSIVGNKCIPNLPDSRTPMFIIYKKGEILNQVVAWGADRERRIEELEALLLVTGAISVPERQHPADDRLRDDDASDDDDYDENSSSRMRSATGKTKNVRTARKSDSEVDSDFEFDL